MSEQSGQRPGGQVGEARQLLGEWARQLHQIQLAKEIGSDYSILVARLQRVQRRLEQEIFSADDDSESIDC